MVRRTLFCIVVALLPTFASAASPGDMAQLRADFAKISFGYAIDVICDVTPNEDKISFMADYIDAHWWMWRARTGVNKTIAKKMSEKAWRETAGGADCNSSALGKIEMAKTQLSSFPANAEAVFGTPSKSLLNPKPDQKRIFATYQAVRLAWIMDEKCSANKKETSTLFVRLMQTRKHLLSVFRPDQLGGQEKSTDQMMMWATLGPCTDKRRSFISFATDALAELETFSLPTVQPDAAVVATEQSPSDNMGN